LLNKKVKRPVKSPKKPNLYLVRDIGINIMKIRAITFTSINKILQNQRHEIQPTEYKLVRKYLVR